MKRLSEPLCRIRPPPSENREDRVGQIERRGRVARLIIDDPQRVAALGQVTASS